MTTNSNRSHPAAEGHRIWVNANYYLRVDHEGFITGTCYEGALGCVVPLLSTYDQNRLALKIPRMLADTVRENAFISQVVHSESLIVYRANEEYKATAGLIPVQAYGRDVLRGVRELRNAPTLDARRQDGCILLFSFGKDRNPRICAVAYKDGQRTVFPPGCEADLSFLTQPLWERALAAACNIEDSAAASYYFEVWPKAHTSMNTATISHAPLLSTMETTEWSQVWFGALPSILYNWANGTLQEMVSQGRLQEWSLDQHYELCCRVLRGVDTLHSKHFIHGDLRPANIMTCGVANAPEDFVVGDYGSFSEELSQFGSPQTGGSGHTTVGGLGRHRTSVFYAPERRTGVERETADVALILSELEDVDVKEEYFLYFGWRSRMLDPRTNAPDETLLQTLREDWRRMIDAKREDRPASVGDRLARGDRLRVREFIFTVLEAEEFEDAEDGAEGQQASGQASERRSFGKRTVFRCHRRFAQVLHERLTVFNHQQKDLADCTVIGLPNYVELRQWSAATDLYGTGALILYTVFMSGVRRGLTSGSESQARVPSGEDPLTNSETLLAQMLEMLEGIPSFFALWSDLEDFRWNLEHADHVGLTGPQLAHLEIRHRHSAALRSGADMEPVYTGHSSDEHRTLGGFALRTVNNLLRSVPNIRHVLQVFQSATLGRGEGNRTPASYNAAHFLLFIHFVMACLHRRTHLRQAEELDRQFPFCRDRCEFAGPDGPANQALARLEELKRRLLQPRYDAIIVHDKQLVNFDPRDVMQIRIEHAQQGRDLASRQQEIAELKERLNEANVRLRERDASCAESGSKLESALEELGQQRARLESLDDQKNRYVLEEMALQDTLASTQHELKRLQVESARLRAENERQGNDLARTRKEVADKDASLDFVRRNCQSLQRRADDGDAAELSLRAQLKEQETLVQQLQGRLAGVDTAMARVMADVARSMEQCMADVAAVADSGWRLPQDRIQRLAKVLALWRDWGAGHPKPADAA